MDFIETVLIVLIMRCFMEYVLFLHWKVLISNDIKTLLHISIRVRCHWKVSGRNGQTSSKIENEKEKKAIIMISS